MKRASDPVVETGVRPSRRVYTILLLASVALLAARAAAAQVEITATASMVKGARNAPVTIVEFSDYQ